MYVHPTLVKAEFHKHFHPAETYVRHKNVCLLKISWLFIGNLMLNSACIFIYSTVSLNCKFMRFLHFLHKMFFRSKTYLFFCCFVFLRWYTQWCQAVGSHPANSTFGILRQPHTNTPTEPFWQTHVTWQRDENAYETQHLVISVQRIFHKVSTIYKKISYFFTYYFFLL